MANSNRVLGKTLIIGVILLLLCMSITPSFATDNTIKPISSGNTLYVGGSGEGNYTKIQDAIDNSSDEDTVFVYNGTYYENIYINKYKLKLIGEDKNTTIIDGEGNLDVIIIKANNVIIEGFSITDGVFSGILIWNQDCIITDNIFTSNENFCIFLFHWNCNNNKIIGNYISNNENGIHIFGSNNIITKNIIINNDGIGIALGKPSNNNFISYNKIISNNGSGIVLGCSYNNTIFKNMISSNVDDSIFLYKSKNNTIINNNLTWNYWYGLNLYYSSCNIISKNNFLGDLRHAYYNNCKNNWKQNYWNKPKILPKLIIGIRTISSRNYPCFNIDWFPAKEPYDIGL